MAIPKFNTDGNLPPGIHLVGWPDFEQRFAITPHRRQLVNGLSSALSVLRTAGCQRVYIDGSYVTRKEVPNDYDAAWEPGGVDLMLLRSLEPVFFDFTNLRAAQKAKFLGEFFPSSVVADSVGTTFLDFFQVDKATGNAKGIIALDL
jgi:hypothetical protein